MREAATERVVVAHPVVEQTCLAVEALTGEIVVGGHAAFAVAPGAVGGEEVAGEQAGAGGGVAEDTQNGAEAIADKEVGGLGAAADLQFAEQATDQAVVVDAASQVARAVVVVFFQPEGVDAQAGGRADGAALQAALAATVIARPGGIGAGDLPFGQVTKRAGE